jgi:tRNA pseudouridine55 synthase
VNKKNNLRNVNGILLLDKPTGITSNTALQKVKRLFSAKKAGHTGSLDPLASGMLPLCFGEATKFSQYLLDADKVYRVTAKLGCKTATGDAEGEIIQQRPIPDLSREKLLSVLEKFQGEIQQIPSMYSALKHQGRPLYELARQGISVERKARPVQIYAINLLEQTADTFSMQVHCSKGTYIRTLVEDIGEVLECGAFVSALRRLSVAGNLEKQMVSLAELEAIQDPALLQRHLLPLDMALMHWPELCLTEATTFYVKRGQPVMIPQAPSNGWVRLTSSNGDFIGIGEVIADGRVAPRRLMTV